MAGIATVTRISAKGIIPVANRDESVALQRYELSEIWPTNSPSASVDGLSGSLKPVGFSLWKAPEIKIEGKATYPNTWPGKNVGDCVITGSIKGSKGQDIDVLTGSWNEPKLVEEAGRKDQVIDAPFDVSLALIEPLGANSDVVIPWGFAGDIKWRVDTPAKFEPKETLPILATTRLEMYRLPANALGGPTEAIASESTLTNFQGKWPVHLLRLFLPKPEDLRGQAAAIKPNVVSWWVGHTYRKITSFGVQYDAFEGRSAYGVGVLGGSFDMASFYDKVDPKPNPFYNKVQLAVNSFDLTCLFEASFRILIPSINAEENPRPRISWIGLSPGGVIAEQKDFKMVPMGWQGDAVSTPFFKGKLAAGDGKVAATAWLEVDMKPGKPTSATTFVVQIAFSSKGTKETESRVDLADITREDFLKRHFAKPDENLDKNSFYDSSSIDSVAAADISGNSLYRKAGLYNMRGVNEPWAWLYTATNGKPPVAAQQTTLRATIGSILQLADKRNGAVSAKRLDLVNAGSLRPSRIYPLLKSGDRYNGDKDYFRLVVGRGVTVATYMVPLGKNGVLVDIKARLKISTFVGFPDALDGLVSELGGFESDISQVVEPNVATDTYGNYMIRTAQSLLFVRNNILVDMTILDLDNYEKPEPRAALLTLAKTLDVYLTASTVSRTQTRSTTFEFVRSKGPQMVETDKPFNLVIRDVDSLAEEIGVFIYSGQSSVRQPIIFTSIEPLNSNIGARTTTRTLNFLPLINDADDAQDVDLAVSGAHYDTFYPITKIARVQLEKLK